MPLQKKMISNRHKGFLPNSSGAGEWTGFLTARPALEASPPHCGEQSPHPFNPSPARAAGRARGSRRRGLRSANPSVRAFQREGGAPRPRPSRGKGGGSSAPARPGGWDASAARRSGTSTRQAADTPHSPARAAPPPDRGRGARRVLRGPTAAAGEGAGATPRPAGPAGCYAPAPPPAGDQGRERRRPGGRGSPAPAPALPTVGAPPPSGDAARPAPSPTRPGKSSPAPPRNPGNRPSVPARPTPRLALRAPRRGLARATWRALGGDLSPRPRARPQPRRRPGGWEPPPQRGARRLRGERAGAAGGGGAAGRGRPHLRHCNARGRRAIISGGSGVRGGEGAGARAAIAAGSRGRAPSHSRGRGERRPGPEPSARKQWPGAAASRPPEPSGREAAARLLRRLRLSPAPPPRGERGRGAAERGRPRALGGPARDRQAGARRRPPTCVRSGWRTEDRGSAGSGRRRQRRG
ncbi:translation initiation factor IF-2-like [Talpa occidentalis]|uniref:translation initiation factor IF-2-like n=1 Tax=Talpa occidentalis TaxID=50954 RepID=UPI0018906E89|nr:translation initiation factor IF-2-like [Talpa occidentalis]